MPKLYANYDVALISALNIDWSIANVFKKTIAANSTFTFSNTEDKSIDVALTNSSGVTITVTFPTNINLDAAFTIAAGKTVIYSFINVNSKMLATSSSN